MKYFTVKDLIEKLSKIEDQNLFVVVDCGDYEGMLSKVEIIDAEDTDVVEVYPLPAVNKIVYLSDPIFE